MNEIIVKKQDKKFNPDIGMFIYDKHDIIASYIDVKSITHVLPLMIPQSFDPFAALERMGINTQKLRSSRYSCPFKKGNSFYGIVPVAIITKSSKPYRSAEFSHNSFDWLFDLEWHAKFFLLDVYSPPNSILSSFIGHGYNSGILPCDGSNNIVNVSIELSNADYIIAKTFEWYNK